MQASPEITFCRKRFFDVLLDVHGEVSPDSPLRDESTRHRAECLPDGEYPRSVDLFLRHAGRLLDELTEDLRLEVLHVETLLEDLLDLFDGVCQAVLTQETVEDLDCLRVSRSILSLLVSCTYVRTSDIVREKVITE